MSEQRVLGSRAEILAARKAKREAARAERERALAAKRQRAAARHARFAPGPATNGRRFIGGRAWKRLRAARHAAKGHPGANHIGPQGLWCSLCRVVIG